MDGVGVHTQKAVAVQPRDPRIFQDRSGNPSGIGTDRVNVLGVGVSSLNMDAAVATLTEARKHGQKGYVCVTGVHGVIESQRDPELKLIHNRSFLTVPDGMPTVWMGREQGFVHMGRVYGPDLMLKVFEATSKGSLGTGHWAPGNEEQVFGTGYKEKALGTRHEALGASEGEGVNCGEAALECGDSSPLSDKAESNFLYPSQDETGSLDLGDSKLGTGHEARGTSDVKANLLRSKTEEGASRAMTHFLFGATEETLVKLKSNLETRFPGAHIVGTYAPPFRPLKEEEELALQEMVAEYTPDFFWVGLSTPKQEKFMASHDPRFLGLGSSDNNPEPSTLKPEPSAPRYPLEAGIMLGVGAAFDIHAGHYKDSPEWIKNSGLQWLHRLCKEPRRLWRRYLDIVPTFLWLSFLQLLGVRKYSLEDWFSENR